MTRWARAKNGVPIGAGRFGLVRSTLPRHAPAGDLDADGVPNVLDIDVNGNLIVNNVDHTKVVRGSLIAGQAAAEAPSNFVKSSLGEWIWETANANAAGFSDAQADTGLSTIGYLVIAIQDGGSVELDCGQPQSRANPTIGGLIYCTKGGTGRVFKGDNQCCTPPTAWPRFPDQYDPDGDGFGSLTPNPSAARAGPSALFLAHGATDSGDRDRRPPDPARDDERRRDRCPEHDPIHVRHRAGARVVQRRPRELRPCLLPGSRAGLRDRRL